MATTEIQEISTTEILYVKINASIISRALQSNSRMCDDGRYLCTKSYRLSISEPYREQLTASDPPNYTYYKDEEEWTVAGVTLKYPTLGFWTPLIFQGEEENIKKVKGVLEEILGKELLPFNQDSVDSLLKFSNLPR